MLGLIANYENIVSCNNFVKNSTSSSEIWIKIQEQYGLQLTGPRFLDSSHIQLQTGESAGD